MSEPRSNVNFVHAEHYPDIVKETLKRLLENKIRVRKGDQIKVQFNDGDMFEHMWIIVEKIKGKDIIGRLDNEPVCVSNVRYKDVVTANLKTITGYMSKDERVVINPVHGAK